MRGFIGMAALSVLLLGGCDRATQPTMPVSTEMDGRVSAREEWQEYRPVPMFSFRAPPGLEQAPAQAVDSAAGVYTGGGIEVVYDYGWYADPLTQSTDPIVSTQHLMVEGAAATLLESERWAAIHFPAAHGEARLTVSVHWETPEARIVGLELLRTVRIR